MNSYAVIMAGGVGARFWPYGTNKLPKQFLPIYGSSDTMLQLTVSRIESIFPPHRIFIITNSNYVSLVKKQVPKIPSENIIGEPAGRNTAPCVAVAAILLKQFDENSTMFVVPADHLITDVSKFIDVISAGIKFAETHDAIVTVGINPTHPETGYGYIQYIDDAHFNIEHKEKSVTINKVKTFAEKPSLDIAKKFLESGDFLWNSGMFIFRTELIIEEYQKSLPGMYLTLSKLEKVIHKPEFEKVFNQVYNSIRGISIDYGIMEKSKRVYVIKGDFNWSDLGSWDEVYRLRQHDESDNVITGDAFVKDAKDNLIINKKGFVGIIGVDDIIVINTKDGVLICKRGRTQEVKEIVDYLKKKGLTDYI
jgi:mannose-1-phosphate guanylyltransferase